MDCAREEDWKPTFFFHNWTKEEHPAGECGEDFKVASILSVHALV